jgi:hypothetical protein
LWACGDTAAVAAENRATGRPLKARADQRASMLCAVSGSCVWGNNYLNMLDAPSRCVRALSRIIRASHLA